MFNVDRINLKENVSEFKNTDHSLTIFVPSCIKKKVQLLKDGKTFIVKIKKKVQISLLCLIGG